MTVIPRLKAVLAGIVITVLGLLGGAWWLGAQFHAPRLYPIGPPPEDLSAQTVTFAGSSNASLKGWLLPAPGSSAGVVLMHGRGGDRRSMLSRARFLQQAGYWALVFDFQANGESPGKHYGSGYLEAEDARAAVRYLRTRARVRRIGIVGFSLGGAAALLGRHGPLSVDAMVLEAVYPTIEAALANRLRLYLGSWAGGLYPLFTWQLKPRLGIGPERLRPIERIATVACPVLIIAGEHDRRTTVDESLGLFHAAPTPKHLWIIPGAKHEDFYRFAPSEYQGRVLEFFRDTLG